MMGSWRALSPTLGLCILLCAPVFLGGCRKATPPPAPSAHEIQEFRDALRDGDAAIVDRLLAARPGLVNVRDEQGRTPLAEAMERGDEEMVQVLRKHGGQP